MFRLDTGFAIAAMFVLLCFAPSAKAQEPINTPFIMDPILVGREIAHPRVRPLPVARTAPSFAFAERVIPVRGRAMRIVAVTDYASLPEPAAQQIAMPKPIKRVRLRWRALDNPIVATLDDIDLPNPLSMIALRPAEETQHDRIAAEAMLQARLSREEAHLAAQLQRRLNRQAERDARATGAIRAFRGEARIGAECLAASDTGSVVARACTGAPEQVATLRDGVLYLGADNRLAIAPDGDWRAGAPLRLQSPPPTSGVRWAYEEQTRVLRALSIELCLQMENGAGALGACDAENVAQVEFHAQWF